MADSFKTSEELVAAIEKKKISTYEYMKYLSQDTLDGLKHSGYSKHTHAEAVFQVLKNSIKEIERMVVKFEKENPD